MKRLSTEELEFVENFVAVLEDAAGTADLFIKDAKGNVTDFTPDEYNTIMAIICDCLNRNTHEDAHDLDLNGIGALKVLSDEQLGALTRYYAEYRTTDVVPEIDDQAVAVAFALIRHKADFCWFPSEGL